MKENVKYFFNKWIVSNSIFFIGFSVYSIFLFLILVSSQSDVFLEFLNNNRNSYLNTFFILSTKIAEEEGILIVLTVLLLFKYSAFVLSVLSISLSTIVANIIKTLTDWPRPLEVYDKISDFSINFVPGVEVHRFMSFPSGHTTAAFAMMFFMLFISKNIYHRLGILLLSISVAISRVYLFQHFTRDVLVGSIIGLLIALSISFVLIHFKWFLELDKKNGLISDIKSKK